MIHTRLSSYYKNKIGPKICFVVSWFCKVRMQQYFFMWPILFSYYEESLVSSKLNYFGFIVSDLTKIPFIKRSFPAFVIKEQPTLYLTRKPWQFDIHNEIFKKKTSLEMYYFWKWIFRSMQITALRYDWIFTFPPSLHTSYMSNSTMYQQSVFGICA